MDVKARRKIISATDAMRDFPEHTCGGSRFMQMLGEQLLKGISAPIEGDEEHVGECLLGVVRELWQLRIERTANADAERLHAALRKIVRTPAYSAESEKMREIAQKALSAAGKKTRKAVAKEQRAEREGDGR